MNQKFCKKQYTLNESSVTCHNMAHSVLEILTSYAYDISIFLTGVNNGFLWSSWINSNAYKRIHDISICGEK